MYRNQDDLRAYYAGCGGHDEWARLARPLGSVEFAVHTRVLASYLPPGSRVLDIGGGPGRYTVWLAERDHRVVLADPSPELLAVARDKVAEAGSSVAARVEEIVEADARDLSRWADGSFDAALSFGPFYHLLDEGDRARAAAELARVLRPGGLLCAALMPRYALLRRALAVPDERRHLADPAFVRRLLDDGVFVNDRPGHFTGAYGARVEEVAPFFARHGFAQLALLGSQGIAAGMEDALAALRRDDPAAYEATLDLAIRTAGDASILGLCYHLLYVGRTSS